MLRQCSIRCPESQGNSFGFSGTWTSRERHAGWRQGWPTAGGKTAPFPPVRPAPPRLRGEPARAGARVAGPRSALPGSTSAQGLPRVGRLRPRQKTPGGGHRVLGVQPCRHQADVHGAILWDSPLRGGHLVGHSVAPPDRAARRHGGSAGPSRSRFLPRAVSRNDTSLRGRERGELGDDREDPPRRDLGVVDISLTRSARSSNLGSVVGTRLRILESEQAGRQVAGFEINAARPQVPRRFLFVLQFWRTAPP